jgi:hypothetical protein
VLASDSDYPGVLSLGIRQQLAANARIGPVCPDEQVGGVGSAVGEAGGDAPIRQHFVRLEGLPEPDYIIHARQENLPQADTADSVMPIGWIRAGGGDFVRPKAKQILELFCGKAKAATGAGDRIQERLPIGRFQTVVQRSAAMRIDVDAVTLQPVGAGQAALVDGDVDAGTAQPLSQAEPTDPTADDHDVRSRTSSHVHQYHSLNHLYPTNS